MSEAYWQAKIWGLLHDPALKALHNNTGRGGNSFWSELAAMQNWQEHGWNPETSGGTLLQHIHLADYIASASDRAAIGSLSSSVNYAPKSQPDKGLEIRHLLSGQKLDFKLKDPAHQKLIQPNRVDYLSQLEKESLNSVATETDCKKLFWWLWRCLPEAVCDEFQDESLMLMPAETRLPDASIWSHTSVTAALAGALAGYKLTHSDIQARWSSDKILSHPYLATFSFTPIQELIKASRKMRDFWTGSWILHYLSAKVCWKLATIYGPDTLLYPSLYHQPLIDNWLLQTWPDFGKWIKQPNSQQLLTAGFPNVLVLVLPKDAVRSAMQTAHQTLLEEWRYLGNLVFKELQTDRGWMPDLKLDSKTWTGWLNAQWQSYWTALPIGVEGENLKNAAIPSDRLDEFQPWQHAQNHAYNLLREKEQVFQPAEMEFLRAAYQHRWETQGRKFSVNVGSWWPYIFDQTRFALTAVKNARTWQIPTAFGPRSTVSGIGPVVHPGDDWITEGETKKLWQQQAGLFDGREQLNATEIVKRGLYKVLPQMFDLEEGQIAASYPDLTAGVAGYLKVNAKSETAHRRHFYQTCQAVINEFRWAEQVLREMAGKWGIPSVDNNFAPKKYHPRLLNAGWLVEDAQTDDLDRLQQDLASESDPTVAEQLRQKIGQLKVTYRSGIQKIIDRHYPSNNPADWYVVAAGDGDGMSEWLKGKKLKSYRDYISSDLEAPSPVRDAFEEFLELPKRMGPATHNALSRALLDFSNQLVPYLTEQRYAGRLIYGGGDDVLAYTNLWEWDNWLWDIRQCFRGDKDPGEQFESEGNYWRWLSNESDALLPKRPLFTMGSEATISFGVAIAHQSVPLAIALENLWAAEKEAKEHKSPNGDNKDAVQVRVLYSNGNILNATSKFGVFRSWQLLLNASPNLESAIFEQAAQQWNQHPAPLPASVIPWTQAFCDRRDLFQGNDTAKDNFQLHLATFITDLWQTTQPKDLDRAIQNWLKVAAFVLRNRDIKLGAHQ